jgi:hypothetical protein
MKKTTCTSSKVEENLHFEDWKPRLFPLEDATVEDEIILEIIE